MTNLAYACLSLCLLAAGAVLFLKYVHFFQLNSYKHGVQKKWVQEHVEEIILRGVWALGAVLLINGLGTLGIWLSCLLFLLVLALNIPKKAKKKLVLTARVKRLGLTYLLIHCLPILLGFCAPEGEAYGALLASFCLTGAPWLLLGADDLNRPMEKAINRRYVREAERLLADAKGLTVIGVTGSYGKTSVKFFLEKLLSVQYNVLVTPENYNTTLGVVRTVRERLKATHEIFVCEMGARNVGDIREICELVKPRYGVITAIGPQHLESFGSIANVVKTKFELADALPEDGTLFRNADDENIRNRKVAVHTVDYGLSRGDFTAQDIRVFEGGSRFTVCGVEFTTRLIGRHNVLNVCAAIAVAVSLGISPEKLVLPVRRLESVPHRLQLLGSGDRLIIDDAYNSNPAGAAAALEALAAFSGLRILVTPGMVELGSQQAELNRQLGLKAASCCDWAILVGEKHAGPIRAGLLEGGFPPERIAVRETVEEAVKLADSLDAGGGRRIILLENDLPDNY